MHNTQWGRTTRTEKKKPTKTKGGFKGYTLWIGHIHENAYSLFTSFVQDHILLPMLPLSVASHGSSLIQLGTSILRFLSFLFVFLASRVWWGSRIKWKGHSQVDLMQPGVGRVVATSNTNPSFLPPSLSYFLPHRCIFHKVERLLGERLALTGRRAQHLPTMGS